MRDSLFDFAVQLFDVDVQPIAILRAMALEVENHRDNVTAERLLVEHAFNNVNRFLNCLVPTVFQVL